MGIMTEEIGQSAMCIIHCWEQLRMGSSTARHIGYKNEIEEHVISSNNCICLTSEESE